MPLARSKLTARSQAPVPAEVCRKLGIGPGSVIERDEEDGHIVVRKAGQYDFGDARAALGFGSRPGKRPAAAVREGIRAHIPSRYARD